MLALMFGPSPRGWGEPQQDRAVGLAGRTIPTRVGRTEFANAARITEADHPHAGGENDEGWTVAGKPGGPSPRGWGERHVSQLHHYRDRTIPTRVGRTLLRRPTLLQGADHPHAGGENLRVARVSGCDHGPSPRGWGEHHARGRRSRAVRTIPTRVGRTIEEARAILPVADHPHAGGENS